MTATNTLQLHSDQVIRNDRVDATAHRERLRKRSVRRLIATILILVTVYFGSDAIGRPIRPGIPDFIQNDPIIGVMILMVLMIGCVAILPYIGAGKSPHQLLYPDQSSMRLADVVGAHATRQEAVDTINLFLSHQTFTDELGGTPRRGVLFEGGPGTGKTYLAKAIAAEAGVPFLFVSASEFQSMFYGQTNRKIRSYFVALRKTARKHGGAIGFIEEFDAIGGSRSGMNTGSMREGIVGVVNELLVQMQSFDLPMGLAKFRAKITGRFNNLLPPHRQIRLRKIVAPNVLIIAATNRASDLDPALMRPGRFDRVIHFDLPPRTDRAEIADFYLAKKMHDDAVTSATIADLTAGYSPVRIERLLDEALIVALRHGRRGFTLDDVVEAQLITEVGLSQDVGYHPEERRRIAIHEAGHALAAVLAGRSVKVASILRRSSSLGLVAHSDDSERHLMTPTEAQNLITISLAGRAAEIQEYGEASSGVAGDLAAATTLAAQLVGAWGASDSLISLEAAQMPIAGNLAAKVLSDPYTRPKVDIQLHEASERVEDQMRRHRTALIAIADALCDHDELSGDKVEALVAANGPTGAVPLFEGSR